MWILVNLHRAHRPVHETTIQLLPNGRPTVIYTSYQDARMELDRLARTSGEPIGIFEIKAVGSVAEHPVTVTTIHPSKAYKYVP